MSNRAFPQSRGPRPDTAALAKANEHILRYVRDVDDGDQSWEFLCECGRADCHERVFLTIDEFFAFRDRGAAVLADGHQASEVARALRLRAEADALRNQAEHQVKRARENLQVSRDLQGLGGGAS